MKIKSINLLLILNLAASLAWGKDFPYGKKLDTDVLEKMISLNETQLVQMILKDVNILVVHEKNKLKYLSRLPKATPAQALAAEIDDPDTVGVYISKNDPCCNFKRDTILIKSGAAPSRLIHEYAHYLLHKHDADAQKPQIIAIMNDSYRVQRRFDFIEKKIFLNAELLEMAQWRDDSEATVDEFYKLMKLATVHIFSEEVIIESELTELLRTKGGSYYVRAERELGLAYAENTVGLIAGRFKAIYFFASNLVGSYSNLLRDQLITQQEFDQRAQKLQTLMADLTEFTKPVPLLKEMVEKQKKWLK